MRVFQKIATAACGGLVVLAVVTAMLPRAAIAAPSLTRGTCWVAKFDNGSKRTLCFRGSRAVTMANTNNVVDSNTWSTCNFSGKYVQSDDKVTVAFAPGSGRCTNGASAPLFVAVCDFRDEKLECRGATMIESEIYEFSGTFE